MKKFTHLWLDDNGLKAFNAPEIESCYPKDCKEPNPTNWLESESRFVCSCRLKEVQALQQALDEGVYFKDNTNTILQYYVATKTDKFELNKPYPVPDGYEVRVERNLNQVEMRLEPEEQYAILVPKEKGASDDYPVMEYKTNRDRLPFPHLVDEMVKHFENVPIQKEKQQSIEEAAEQEFKKGKYQTGGVSFTTFEKGFIAGAKSQAAKEYWFEQFKRES